MKLMILLMLLFLSMQVNGAIINILTESLSERTYSLSIATEFEYTGFGSVTQGDFIDLKGLGDRFEGTY